FAGAPLSELGPQSPLAATHHMQLLLVQRPDGGLTIGDTHAYDEPFDFALSEGPTVELLARAARILGAPLPPVRRRWEGVYAQRRDGAVCLSEEIQARVVLVTGPGGRGMTCAPAIAGTTLEATRKALPARSPPSPSPASIWPARPYATKARSKPRSRTRSVPAGSFPARPVPPRRPIWCAPRWP